MNINQNISKLLIALGIKGQMYKINSFKFYSEKARKYLTKYQLLELLKIPKINKITKKEEIEEKYVVVLETYSNVEMMKFLAEEYKIIKEEIEGSEADGR